MPPHSRNKTSPKITKLPHYTCNSMISETKMIFSGPISHESTNKILKDYKSNTPVNKSKSKTPVSTVLLNYNRHNKKNKHPNPSPKSMSVAKLNSINPKSTLPPSITTAPNKSKHSSQRSPKRIKEWNKSQKNHNKCTKQSFIFNKKMNLSKDNSQTCKISSKPNQNKWKATNSKSKNWESFWKRKDNLSKIKEKTYNHKETTIMQPNIKLIDSFGKITDSLKKLECWKSKKTLSMLS